MSDHLAWAAKARHDSAVSKATAALHELSVQQLPVTFVEVARRAGVSTDFLYRQPALRSTITSLRTTTRPAAAGERHVGPDDSTSAAVRALAARVKDLQTRHRAEVAALQQALAAAHGENLMLRRRLAGHEG